MSNETDSRFAAETERNGKDSYCRNARQRIDTKLLRQKAGD